MKEDRPVKDRGYRGFIWRQKTTLKPLRHSSKEEPHGHPGYLCRLPYHVTAHVWVIKQRFATVSEEDKRKILCTNAVRLYGIALEEVPRSQ